VPLPPYSPELNPCEQLWDVLKDTEGFANGLFESIENLRKALHPGLKGDAFGMTLTRSFRLLVAHGYSLNQTLPRKVIRRFILKRWYKSICRLLRFQVAVTSFCGFFGKRNRC